MGNYGRQILTLAKLLNYESPASRLRRRKLPERRLGQRRNGRFATVLPPVLQGLNYFHEELLDTAAWVGDTLHGQVTWFPKTPWRIHG
jgi:hypothetical protein